MHINWHTEGYESWHLVIWRILEIIKILSVTRIVNNNLLQIIPSPPPPTKEKMNKIIWKSTFQIGHSGFERMCEWTKGLMECPTIRLRWSAALSNESNICSWVKEWFPFCSAADARNDEISHPEKLDDARANIKKLEKKSRWRLKGRKRRVVQEQGQIRDGEQVCGFHHSQVYQ